MTVPAGRERAPQNGAGLITLADERRASEKARRLRKHDDIHCPAIRVEEKIWLVSFMRYDLGFFDHETCRIESAENPFAAKLLPMSPV